MHARRSCLSVPGSSEKMLRKAGTLGADEVVVDLEDSVAPGAKEEARELVVRLLSEGAIEAAAVAVRVNGLDSQWWADDVAALRGAAINSLVVPKFESPDDVKRIEKAAPETRIQALIETATGLQHAGEIASASGRMDSLILGYADLAASLGRVGGDVPGRWQHAQETVLVAARSAGIQAIDGPYLSLDDEDGLRWRAEYTRDLGYDGKWAIHPSQVPVINDAFTPPREEFERACAVLAALERAEADEGRGAVELHGDMNDEASRKLARTIVARGRAAGFEAEGAAR